MSLRKNGRSGVSRFLMERLTLHTSCSCAERWMHSLLPNNFDELGGRGVYVAAITQVGILIFIMVITLVSSLQFREVRKLTVALPVLATALITKKKDIALPFCTRYTRDSFRPLEKDSFRRRGGATQEIGDLGGGGVPASTIAIRSQARSPLGACRTIAAPSVNSSSLGRTC